MIKRKKNTPSPQTTKWSQNNNRKYNLIWWLCFNFMTWFPPFSFCWWQNYKTEQEGVVPLPPEQLLDKRNMKSNRNSSETDSWTADLNILIFSGLLNPAQRMIKRKNMRHNPPPPKIQSECRITIVRTILSGGIALTSWLGFFQFPFINGKTTKLNKRWVVPLPPE